MNIAISLYITFVVIVNCVLRFGVLGDLIEKGKYCPEELTRSEKLLLNIGFIVGLIVVPLGFIFLKGFIK